MVVSNAVLSEMAWEPTMLFVGSVTGVVVGVVFSECTATGSGSGIVTVVVSCAVAPLPVATSDVAVYAIVLVSE